MKQLLNPESVINSLEVALTKPFDYSSAVRRLNGSISGIAPGTLHMKHRNDCICFAEYRDGKQFFVSKTSKRVYELARRKYCSLLLHVLKIYSLQADGSQKLKQEAFAKLADFIRMLDAANLDVARVVLTSKQYEWYTKSFKQKPNKANLAIYTEGGVHVRSKSEKDIGNELESNAVIYHFEEALRINVSELVNALAGELNLRPRNGSLFHYVNGSCYWNVPSALEWINCDGSLWRAYDSNTGLITIFPDFRIMLADGSFMFWEHEGLIDNFVYRCNASERELIMRYSGDVPAGNLIATFEKDTMNSLRVGEIIKSEILPRLFW